MALFSKALRQQIGSLQTLTKTAKTSTSKVTSSFNLNGISFKDSLRSVIQQKSVSQPAFRQIANISANLPALQVSLKKDIKLAVPNLIQGQNECGPTSLAMIMQYYGIDPGNYHNMFSSDTVGHGPLALRRKAVNKNMTVRQENYGSLNDLAALVDKGIPVMTLGIYGGGSNSSLSNYIDNAKRAHWMVVTGYKKDENGQITHVYFNNPNRSTTQCWTASDFMNKFWNNNIIPGGHRYYMAMAKKGSFQESALKTYLPSDKLSDSFKSTLSVVDGLESAFYAAEEAANTVADAAEDVWDEVSSWFS